MVESVHCGKPSQLQTLYEGQYCPICLGKGTERKGKRKRTKGKGVNKRHYMMCELCIVIRDTDRMDCAGDNCRARFVA